MRKAKIVCTLGPASDDRATIRALAEAGMSVARLNASHGTVAERAATIDRIRAVDDVVETPLAAMVDLQGPEVRTATLDEPIHLETGSTVRFVVGDTATPEEVGLSVAIDAAAPGDRILLDDGHIEATVEAIEGETVLARVDSGGELGGRKGVHVPGVDLDVDRITDTDYRDLEVAVERDADFVAASFVRDASDVYAVSDALGALGGDIPVVAKIERASAVATLDAIVGAADGVMVARGDLGVECPLEEVPMIQKRIIRRCQAAGVPVITATEMLDSMVHARRPTRAEASDVANAVLDGTDAVMLSGETAVGDHPVRVVETMDRIVDEVEASEEYAESQAQHVPIPAADSRTEALARSARSLARDIGAAAIVTASESGYTARKTAMFRPTVPIVTTTPSDAVRRQLALTWGVRAQYAPYAEGIDAVVESAVTAALDAGVAESGDTVVVLSGMMTELEGTNTTNMLKVHVAAETVAVGRKIVGGRAVGPLARAPDGDLTTLPDGAILAVDTDFDGEFTGDVSTLGGIVDAHSGLTGYPALFARELDVPMISDAPIPDALADGTTLTLYAERGVVYEGDVLKHERPA
ncbi:MAG: pyruvate kinase [Halobacteriota archaeon]